MLCCTFSLLFSLKGILHETSIRWSKRHVIAEATYLLDNADCLSRESFRGFQEQEMEQNAHQKKLEEMMRTFAMSWKIVVLHPANGYPFNFWGIWYVIGNLSFKLYFMALWLFTVHYTKTHERKCEHASWFMATWTFDVICILHASSWWELALGVCMVINTFCLQQPARTTNKKKCLLLVKGM